MYFTDDAVAEGEHQRRAIRFIGMVRDVTRHRMQELTIAENEERFYRAIREAQIPIMITGEQGEVVEVNRAWQEITAYAMEETPTMARW